MNKKKFLIALLFILCAGVARAQDCDIAGVQADAPKLCGAAKQGGWLYGTAAGWDVFWGDKKISLNDIFVLGLARDAEKTVDLKFCAGDSCKTYTYAVAARKYDEQRVPGIPPKFDKKNRTPEIQARIDRETADIVRVRAAAMGDTATYFLQLRLPKQMKDWVITSTYGSKRAYNQEPFGTDFHKGYDYSAKNSKNQSIYPIGVGRVILAADHYLNGKIVIISHGHGITSTYMHMSKTDVTVGDRVDENTKIGVIGNTGKSSGIHEHVQFNWIQIPIDMMYMLQK